MSKLKAYVRYDERGRAIPSSLVLRHNKPDGRFKEMVDPDTYLCCSFTGRSFNATITTGFGQYEALTIDGFIIGTMTDSSVDLATTVDSLNALYTGFATFTITDALNSIVKVTLLTDTYSGITLTNFATP